MLKWINRKEKIKKKAFRKQTALEQMVFRINSFPTNGVITNGGFRTPVFFGNYGTVKKNNLCNMECKKKF